MRQCYAYSTTAIQIQEGEVGLVCSYLRRTDETAHGRRDPWWQKKKEKWSGRLVHFSTGMYLHRFILTQ